MFLRHLDMHVRSSQWFVTIKIHHQYVDEKTRKKEAELEPKCRPGYRTNRLLLLLSLSC